MLRLPRTGSRAHTIAHGRSPGRVGGRLKGFRDPSRSVFHGRERGKTLHMVRIGYAMAGKHTRPHDVADAARPDRRRPPGGDPFPDPPPAEEPPP
ncbi:hypothetical protein Slala03_74460 [Streptomyces lavendulae subsp. lavendulae]|nr:hypothetical protein Slala03_74460 [Streptomyces lavendulae subsp. lavendulae]